MPRATNGPASRQRKNRMFKRTKGNFLGRKNLLRTARETLNRAWRYAFRDRRVNKRNFRALWITRIGIAARMQGLTYNAFIHGVEKAGITLNRKMLAEIAVNDPKGFAQLAGTLKGA